MPGLPRGLCTMQTSISRAGATDPQRYCTQTDLNSCGYVLLMRNDVAGSDQWINVSLFAQSVISTT